MIALVGAGVLALGGCARGTVQNALGIGKRTPDEFSVVQRAPLVIPPDFELRPPRPGEARPQTSTSDQARAALTGQPTTPLGQPATALGQPTTPALAGLPVDHQAGQPGLTTLQPVPAVAAPGPTPGQQALLTQAERGGVDPQIRTRIAEENEQLAQVEQALFTRVMNWREPNTLGATVDAPAEAERLRTARAQGEPPTAGDTPTVVERRQSPLGALIQKVF
jgi:DUF3035 family protein